MVRHFDNPHVGQAWLNSECRAGRIDIVTPLTRSRADRKWYAVIRQHRVAWWVRYRAALITGAVLSVLAVLAGVVLAAWAFRMWIGAAMLVGAVLGVLSLIGSGGSGGGWVFVSGWLKVHR